MTDDSTEASNPAQAAEPLALRLNDQLGLMDRIEREALALLSAEFGTTTGDLAQQMPSMAAWGYSRRAQSQNALTVLRRLQARGLVKWMDDQKPIAWILARPNAKLNGTQQHEQT